MNWIWIVIGVLCVVCAFVVYCCCVIGGREDDRMEKYRRSREDCAGEGKDA